MNAKLFLLLGLAVLVARASADGYDFDDDFEKCVDESDDTVEGSSDNDGNCTLYQGFEKVQTNVTESCDATSQAAYVTFLNDIKAILAVASHPNPKKYILVSGRLDKFAAAYPTCYSAFESVNITVIANVKMMKSIVIYKQQQTISTTIILDGSGNCPLFAALRAAATATGNPTTSSDVETFISSELTVIVNDDSLSLSEKIDQLSEKIQEFLESHSDLEVELEDSEIEGFGFFLQFFSCATVYKQKTEISTLFVGTYPDIPIYNYFQAQFNTLTTIQDKAKFNLFFNKVKAILQNSTLTVEQKQFAIINNAQAFSSIHYTFAYQFVFSASFGEFGSFWDFCFSTICPEPILVTPGTEGSTASSTTLLPSSTTLLPSTSTACSCTCEPLI